MAENDIKFLLVEDDDIDAEQVERGFNKLGINSLIIRANNGVEALDLLTSKTNLISGKIVVLLDLNMPQMNGLEFIHEVRKDPKLIKMPIFVFSSSENESDINEAFRSHISGYIIKPFDNKDMLDILEKIHAYIKINELPLINCD